MVPFIKIFHKLQKRAKNVISKRKISKKRLWSNKKDRHICRFILCFTHNKMGYNSVPILSISIQIEPIAPAGNCLNPESGKIRIPDPEIQKSGFFESCRARYELSIRTYDAEMNFGGKNSDRHYQRKIGGPILKRRRSIHFYMIRTLESRD